MRMMAATALVVLALATSAQAAPFGQCAKSGDAPGCLVREAVSRGGWDANQALRAAVATGSVELIAAKPSLAVQGGSDHPDEVRQFLRMVGGDGSPTSVRRAAKAKLTPTKVAAAALAAAAARTSQPFDDPTVRELMGVAGEDAAVEQLAVAIWSDMAMSNAWPSSARTWPPGMGKVWDAIIADPPRNSEVLAELGTTAAWSGFRDKGLVLFRLVAGRPQATANTKAHAASDLARLYGLADEAQRLLDSGGDRASGYVVPGIRVEIAEARLKHGYDAAAVATVVAEERAALLREAQYLEVGERETLVALEAAGAKVELLALARDFLMRARQDEPDPQDRGDWYALASDAFLKAGKRDEAVAAAREGVPYVAAAVSNRTEGTTGQAQGASIEQHRAAAVAAVYGTAPIVAIYRAGEREEALRSGYLTGFWRYKSATVAGEQPDPRWVVGDRSWPDIELMYLVLLDGDRTSASLLYDELARSHEWFKSRSDVDWHAKLALFAALAGRRAEMLDHLTAEADVLDRPGLDDPGFWALELAREWRQTELISSPPKN